MNLTDEQKDQVREWAASGASLSEIQTRLAEEFEIRMSYMDTRFLVIDLEASIKDKEVPAEKKPEAPVADEAGASAAATAEMEAAMNEMDEPAAGGAVSVELSPIARPGYAACGSVVFSDGVKAEWGITNDGQLSLDPETVGYRPTQDDIRAFQMELRKIFSAQGY